MLSQSGFFREDELLLPEFIQYDSFLSLDPDDSTQGEKQLLFYSNVQLSFRSGIKHPFISLSVLESLNRINWAIVRNGQMGAN